MNNSELSQRDLENIGKWERVFTATGRSTYTIKEASAFLIDWHPGAYLNDYRKNQIEGMTQRIKSAITTSLYGNEECHFLENEEAVMYRSELSFSKATYFKFVQSSSLFPQTDIYSLEWFKDLRKGHNIYGHEELIDIKATRFTPLVPGSEIWKTWKDLDCYTIEEMAYLIQGLVPIKDGRNIDEKAYLSLITPLKEEIKTKVTGLNRFNLEPDDDIPF